MGALTMIFIFMCVHTFGRGTAAQRANAQFANARAHNLEPDSRAAVPPHEDPGHNTHQEAVIFGCLGIIVVFAVLCTLILWFVVERTKSDIRRLDRVIPTIAERMRREMITANGELMSGTLTASHEFETEFLTNEDVQLTSYRQRRGEEQEEQEDTEGAEASAPPEEMAEEATAAEAIAIAAEGATGHDHGDGETSRRENEENAEQNEQIELIDGSRRERRSDRHNRHSHPQHYHHDRHSHERRSHERHSRERRSYERHMERYYDRQRERDREHIQDRHYERRPETRHTAPESNYINFGATADVTLETRPPPPAYVHAYDNPGMSLRDEREYRRSPRRNTPRTAPKPDHRPSRPSSAYVTSGSDFRDESTRPISVIGLMDDANERWPSIYGYNSGRKYRSLLYESHV